jgi:DNA-binding transcriptional ArsR family regulator
MVAVLFSCADLARTRVASQPSAEAELLFSLRMLSEPQTRCFLPWRRKLAGRLDTDMRVLVNAFSADQPSRPSRQRLGNQTDEVVSRYRDLAIAPYWTRIRTLVDADRSRRARTLLDGGVDQLLATLHPSVHWRPPVLEVNQPSGRRAEVRLDGTGLLLQPCIFLWRGPVLRCPEQAPPTLLYGVSCEMTGGGDDDGQVLDLGALVGRTRAAMLGLLTGSGATTTELARRTGLSLAAASQHTGVLREAGLITTQHLGRGRLHALTALGSALLGQPHRRPGADRAYAPRGASPAAR